MTMPGRKFIASPPVGGAGGGYRYGFNGKELDKDIASDDYDFGARIYDGRIGRFLSVDGYASYLPFESNYVYCGNEPISHIDRDGNVRIKFIKVINEQTGVTTIKVETIDRKLKRFLHPDTEVWSFHFEEWDWYDYMEIEVWTINKDGEAKKGETEFILGEKRTQTLWNWGEAYANLQIDDGILEDWGGIAWTGANGQNYENKKGRPSHFAKIDNLLKAIGDLNSLSKKGMKKDDFDKIQSYAKKVTEILKKFGIETEDKGADIIQARDKELDNLYNEMNKLIEKYTPKEKGSSKYKEIAKTIKTSKNKAVRPKPIKKYFSGGSAEKETGFSQGSYAHPNPSKPDTLYYDDPPKKSN